MEALKKLRASVKTAHIPILVLSGSIEPTEVAKVTELGAAEFLEKPANPEVIYQAIARLAGVEAKED